MDTHEFPTAGTCPPYSAGGVSYTACVTNAKLLAEVNAVIGEEEWPHGLDAAYYVFLPPHMGTCFGGSGESCFDQEWCAYHDYDEAHQTIYANIPYAPGDTGGCGVGQYPNGVSNGKADDVFSVLSHEANESITDPTLEAWYDSEGFENADECRNVPEEFGSPLGGSPGSLYNQSIAGDHYYLQQEWSNDAAACVQRVAPPSVAIADSGTLHAGTPAQFADTGTAPGAGGIVSESWQFGDGGTGTGSSPSHTYAESGSFDVTLTVSDDGGFEFSATRQVKVVGPPLAITEAADPVGRRAATLAGTVNPEAAPTTYHFDYGPTTEYGFETEAADAGEGEAAVPVEAALEGLVPVTEYHFRLVAENANGPAFGEDRSFETEAAPPLITTDPASAITATGADLGGSVNPEHSPASYHFEYGTTTAYGSELDIAQLSAETKAIPVEATLQGLEPATEYHFRLVAENVGGETFGEDRAFTTEAAPQPQERVLSTSAGLGGEGRPLGISSALRVARVRGGRALVRLRCPGTAPCEGALRLQRGGVLGRAAFSLSEGRTFTIRVRLNGRGRELLRRARRRRLAVRLAGTGVRERKVMLRAGPRRMGPAAPRSAA